MIYYNCVYCIYDRTRATMTIGLVFYRNNNHNNNNCDHRKRPCEILGCVCVSVTSFVVKPERA